MTFVQLEAFLAVIRTGSFTKAGELLHMTQSAVSHMIADLEAELGAVLLIRGRKGVSMTEAGSAVFSHAEAILTHVAQLHGQLAEIKGLGDAGPIRIGSFPSVSARLLPALLQGFEERYPGIQLVSMDGTNQEVRNWIDRGAVHLGFVSLPDDDFDTIFLLEDELVAVVPEGHRLAGREKVPVAELQGESFIMTKGGCEGTILRMFKTNLPNIVYEVKETSTILTMVQHGLGITVLPRMALPSSPEGAAVLSLSPFHSRRLGIGVPALAEASPAARLFIEYCRTQLDKGHSLE